MKKHLHYFIIVFFISFSSISLWGKEIKILAIGNSFSEDAVEQYLYELALEGGDNLIIGNAYRGGQGLQSHWEVANANKSEFEYRKIVNGNRTNTNKTLQQCIVDENWDYITFQQVSQDSGLEPTYEPWLTYLLTYVKQHVTNPNVKYGLHRTWAYSKNSGHDGFNNYGRDQQTMFEAIVNTVNAVFQQHDDIEFIIPSGTAIQNGRGSFIGDNFCRDGYHLTYGMGRYTAACTWLEALTGQNPIGKTYRPSSVSEIEAKVAQYAAHYSILTPNEVTSMDNFGFTGENTIEPSAPVKINFGSEAAIEGWSDITPSLKYVFGLKDTNGNDTEMVIILDDDFSGTNTDGVQATTTSLNIPAAISTSCVWGYSKGSFAGGSFQQTGGFLFSHLNKNLVYDFYIFGSRKNVSDNRETEYIIQGENRKRNYLDAANNAGNIAFVKGIKPTGNGEIRLTVSAGANNTNGNNFYYINALQVVARQYTEGDFDDDETDPMLNIDEEQKYYIRHTKTGLYLKSAPGEEGDFSLSRISYGNSDFEFKFKQITSNKPIYNISVNNQYINAGEDGKCILGELTDADNGQIRMILTDDLLSFKLSALWASSSNYMNFRNIVPGAYMYANRNDGAVWKLEKAKITTDINYHNTDRVLIYPTLSNGELTIYTANKADIKIVNLTGRLMAHYTSNGYLPLSLEFPNGMYLVTIHNNTYKIILNK